MPKYRSNPGLHRRLGARNHDWNRPYQSLTAALLSVLKVFLNITNCRLFPITGRNHQSYAVLYSHVNIPHLAGHEGEGGGACHRFIRAALASMGQRGVSDFHFKYCLCMLT